MIVRPNGNRIVHILHVETKTGPSLLVVARDKGDGGFSVDFFDPYHLEDRSIVCETEAEAREKAEGIAEEFAS